MPLLATGIGLIIGFPGGLFGKGGSAIATPMLHAAGYPAHRGRRVPAPGHIDWNLVLDSGATSIPFSYLVARVAIRTDPSHLERIYGAALAALGIVFLLRS